MISYHLNRRRNSRTYKTSPESALNDRPTGEDVHVIAVVVRHTETVIKSEAFVLQFPDAAISIKAIYPQRDTRVRLMPQSISDAWNDLPSVGNTESHLTSLLLIIIRCK